MQLQSCTWKGTLDCSQVNSDKNDVATFDVYVNDVTNKTNQLTGHLIIIKQPECFPKSDGYPKSLNKLTLNKTAIKTSKQTELILI